MEQGLIKIERNEKGILVVSSRVIAEQLGKRHDNVVRDLERILENSNVSSLIISSTYRVDGQKREYKEYLLTKDGFTLYMFNIQGHNDFKLAYINRFNEMERALQVKQDSYMIEDPIERAKRWIEEQEERKRLELKIQQDKPLVDFANQVSTSSDSILVRQFAKLLSDENIKIGERKLYQWFRDNGYVCKNSTEPTQRSINQNLFEIVERTVKTPYGDKIVQTTKITGKGQIYFTEKLRKEIKK